MPVRAASVWRQISERAESSPFGLPSVNGELANSAVITGCSARPTRSLATMSASLDEIEIGLDGRGAKHHVEAAGSDFRHVVGHDRVAALRHHRRFGQRPFRAHAEREKADPQRLGDGARDRKMAIKLVGGRVRVVERRAGKLELSAGLERNGAAAVRVVEADQMAAVFDAVPAEPLAHAFEQRPNAACAAVGDRRMVGAVEGDLFVLGADPERARRLAPRFEPRDQGVARLHNLTIDDVASHAGAHPSGRRTGDPAR